MKARLVVTWDTLLFLLFCPVLALRLCRFMTFILFMVDLFAVGNSVAGLVGNLLLFLWTVLALRIYGPARKT